jgi:hypothetical protein
MEADLIAQARSADDIEAAAFRDMFATVPNSLVRALNPHSLEVAGATLLMANGFPDPMFSRVIGLGNSGAIVDTQIDNVVTAYRDASIGTYWIHVNPVVAPSDLGARLEHRGFKLAKRRTWAKMIRGTEPITPIDTVLTTRVATANDYTAVSNAIAVAFGMPSPFALWIQNMAATTKWTLIAALDGARIVGGGLLFIENQLAWLGMGGVIPEVRGRHAHRAIMTHRIDLAIERGCTHIVTETGEPINDEPNPSLRNMYRCGFTRVCARLNYMIADKVVSR